jgi:uncharacterized membrane protein YeaQ/YmgE (transglycosylase-associated protein family)
MHRGAPGLRINNRRRVSRVWGDMGDVIFLWGRGKIALPMKGVDAVNIFGWIIIGALAGWLASMITGNNAEMGAWKNIGAGVVGAFLGGFVFDLFGGTGVTGFNPWSLIVATVGAIIFLMIINMFRRGKPTR